MSIPPDLPPDLKAILETLVHGVSRNAMAKRVAAQSRIYRAGGASDIIASADDALAYALARLPATYAATTAVLNALCEGLPTLHPRTVLDVGAGPGGASFAASAMFAGIDEFRMIDANPDLRRLALTLMAGADSASLRHAAGDHAYRHGDALTLLAGAAPADLVIASYVAGEIADLDLARFAHALWRATAGALAIIRCARGGAVPAGPGLSAAGAGLVPLCATAAALARPSAGEGRGGAVRGREVRLRRVVARRAASDRRAGAGTAARGEERRHHQALHRARHRHRHRHAARGRGLPAAQIMALGRRRRPHSALPGTRVKVREGQAL
jgi:hypothetical protein